MQVTHLEVNIVMCLGYMQEALTPYVMLFDFAQPSQTEPRSQALGTAVPIQANLAKSVAAAPRKAACAHGRLARRLGGQQLVPIRASACFSRSWPEDCGLFFCSCCLF